MNAPFLLTWLAGTLLPLGALWLVYRLALRGERCFGYNRALLLLAPLLAAALPLLPRPALPTWLGSPMVAVAAGKADVAVLLPMAQVGPAATPAGWSGWAWLVALYLVGVALGLGRLGWQAGRLWALARRLPREPRAGYVLAYTGGQLPTSSFGGVVFWNETANLPLAEELAVLTHEVAHVHQRHTLDILWLEAWRAVLWVNPFAHLLLPALRLTHELLADAAASNSTHSTSYPTMLARLAARQLGAPAYSALLQPFTFSFTLTRIAMLQNQTPVRRWKQWLVLPVLAGMIPLVSRSANAQPTPSQPTPAQPAPPTPAQPVIVSFPSNADKQTFNGKVREAMHLDSLRTGGRFEPGTRQEVSVKRTAEQPDVIKAIVTRVPDAPPAPRPVTSSGHTIYTYVEEMPQLPGGGGVPALVQAVRSKISYPKTAPGEVLPSGRVFATFVVDTDGSVQGIKIVKGLSPALDAAVLAALQQLPRFEPGKQDGQPMAVSFTIPIEFKPKP